ncbi:MAG: molybdopterin-binding protein [Thermoplasmata archaeon]
MIKCSILVTGDEILNCSVKDENYYFLCSELNSLGYFCNEVVFVRDSIDEIVFYLRKFLNNVDLVIITGGLGPTWDDITLDSISKAFKIPLSLNNEALNLIKKRYEYLSKNIEINKWREKMAYLPLGSIPIKNDVGTAPGIILKLEKTIFIALPGVPKEMKNMFINHVKNELIETFGKFTYLEKNFILNGTDESTISPLLEHLRYKFPEIYIKSRAGLSENFNKILINVVIREKDIETCKKNFDVFLKYFKKELEKINISMEMI